MMGPIDYIIVGFKGNKFDGSILKAVGDAVDKGVINLIALTAVVKDAAGKVTGMDVADSGDEFAIKFVSEHGTSNIMPTDRADIDEVGEMLENDTAAGLLIVEQVWARPLKQAILDANGTLIAEGRIHP